MKYYKLMYNFENDDNYVDCKKTDLVGVSEYVVTDGVKVNEWDEDLILEYDPKEGNQFTDYLANAFGWLIFSEEFIKLADKYIDDRVQLLDLKIRNSISKDTISSYKIANVVDVIDAIDLDHSVYDEFELDNEKFIFVEKYALKESEEIGHHIFKLKEDTVPTFISEDLKKLIVHNRLTGFSFLEVSVV